MTVFATKILSQSFIIKARLQMLYSKTEQSNNNLLVSQNRLKFPNLLIDFYYLLEDQTLVDGPEAFHPKGRRHFP